MEELLIVYYIFSLFFTIGVTKWENFNSNLGKVGYLFLVVITSCWAIFPIVLGIRNQLKEK